MRSWTLRRTRLRAMRAVAGLVAAFLLTGNVLAAAGLCVAKAPVQAAAVELSSDEDAGSPGCAEHLADEGATGSTQARHHCPTDDPTAQARTADLPAPQMMVAFAAVLLGALAAAQQADTGLAANDPSEPRPLYARLQRLRL